MGGLLVNASTNGDCIVCTLGAFVITDLLITSFNYNIIREIWKVR